MRGSWGAGPTRSAPRGTSTSSPRRHSSCWPTLERPGPVGRHPRRARRRAARVHPRRVRDRGASDRPLPGLCDRRRLRGRRDPAVLWAFAVTPRSRRSSASPSTLSGRCWPTPAPAEPILYGFSARTTRQEGCMRTIVDISVPLKAGIASDPPGLTPEIEFRNHSRHRGRDAVVLPRPDAGRPAGRRGLGGRERPALDPQRHAPRRALSLPLDDGQGRARHHDRRGAARMVLPARREARLPRLRRTATSSPPTTSRPS